MSYYGKDFGNWFSHAYYTGNDGKSVKSVSNPVQKHVSSSTSTSKKRDLNGTSVSNNRGTDGKKNNTSEYNHDYYMKNKDKWNVKDDDQNEENSNEESNSEEKEFDVDAAALDVIRGKYGNGQERKDALGDDYEIVQKRVNEMYKEGRFGTSNTKKKTSTDDSEDPKKSKNDSEDLDGKEKAIKNNKNKIVKL